MPNLSYAHGASDIPLLGETISQNLKRTVDRFPDAEALVVPYQNYRANYAQFWMQTTEVAKSLLAFGVKKGDRVGIWSANRYEWVIIQYASARVGAILVNINPAYRPVELKYALKHSGVSLLIMSKAFRQTNYLEILSQVRNDCIHLQKVVVIDHDWAAFLSEGRHISDGALEEIENSLQFDEAINIQYTSGTTGFPKGATLTHHNILNNGYFIGERLRYNQFERVCIPVPFYHCFGMVLANMACTSHGSCMVIPGEAFDPEIVLKTVQDEKCTSLYGVPAMFIAELDHQNFSHYDLSTLHTGIMAGASCPVKTMNEVIGRMHMKDVQICYGMTETSPVSTQTMSGDPIEKRVSTVGRVQEHVEIKIVDKDTGYILPLNLQGELCTRGYSVMLKYWDNEEATRAVIDDAGWMHTGDLAVMDEEGYVKITGRIKDMILRGGENIGPLEIEEFLRSHEAVSDVHVIGVPSYKYGEEVMAWIKLKENKIATGPELGDYCKGQIATYKIPRYWKFVDSFPITVTGKIRKVEMREISTRELGLEGVRQGEKFEYIDTDSIK
ncbi:MAG: AMP-binding protein [Cyclobacteriaceae bacterium]|nr:AMP-binding protein [Cyclobacteriaceae bacterium]